MQINLNKNEFEMIRKWALKSGFSDVRVNRIRSIQEIILVKKIVKWIKEYHQE